MIQISDETVEEMTLSVTLLSKEGTPLPVLPTRSVRFLRIKETARNSEAVTWEIGPERCRENQGIVRFVECASPTGAVRTRLTCDQAFIEDATLTFLRDSIVLDHLATTGE